MIYYSKDGVVIQDDDLPTDADSEQILKSKDKLTWVQRTGFDKNSVDTTRIDIYACPRLGSKASVFECKNCIYMVCSKVVNCDCPRPHTVLCCFNDELSKLSYDGTDVVVST